MSTWGASYDAQVKSERGDQANDGSATEKLAEKTQKLDLQISGEIGQMQTVSPGAAPFNGGAPPPQHSFGATQRGSPFGMGGMRGGGYASGMSRGAGPNFNQPSSRGAMMGGGPATGYAPRGRGGVSHQAPPPGGFFPNRTYVNPDMKRPQKSETHGAGGDEPVEKPMSPEEIALLNKFLHRTVKMMQDGTVDVSKQQLDPKSPLHSILAFRDLRINDELLRALDLMGFQQPSKIQEFALPLLLMEPPTNMIAQSQSGTGKTAAFVLTMLSRVVPENKWPQCVCLAPTYELAMQIGEVVSRMAKFMPEVKVHYAVKGVRPPRGASITEQILIGTPGKMIDYIDKLRCFDPAKVICLVLDEADVMISQGGHLDLSYRIYNAIENASPNVQTMLFSATYDAHVMEFAEKLIKDAISVTLKREDQSLPNIKQYFVECTSRDAKYQAVCDLYSGLIIASAVIFTHTRSSATWLAQRMREKGHEVALLHGEMSVQDRAMSIEQFKDGVHKILITTNVCARGIDVSQVSIVINYDPPVFIDRPGEPDCETYLHRIGRTGRFGKAGIAINFVDSNESLQLIKKIETHFGKPILKLDPSDIEQLEAIERD